MRKIKCFTWRTLFRVNLIYLQIIVSSSESFDGKYIDNTIFLLKGIVMIANLVK